MKSSSATKKSTDPLRRRTGKGYLHPVSIYVAAEKLGVCASHVRRVIKGEATSKRITEGYAALVAEMKAKNKGAA